MKKMTVILIVSLVASVHANLIFPEQLVFPERVTDSITIDTDVSIGGYDISVVVVSGDVVFNADNVVFNDEYDWPWPAIVVIDSPVEIRLTASGWVPEEGYVFYGPGNLFHITGISGQGYVQVLNYNEPYDPFNPVVLGTIEVVPEPATLLLVGLGGMLVRLRWQNVR